MPAVVSGLIHCAGPERRDTLFETWNRNRPGCEVGSLGGRGVICILRGQKYSDRAPGVGPGVGPEVGVRRIAA